MTEDTRKESLAGALQSVMSGQTQGEAGESATDEALQGTPPVPPPDVGTDLPVVEGDAPSQATPPAPELSERAEKRFQKLLSERNEAREEIDRLKSQVASLESSAGRDDIIASLVKEVDESGQELDAQTIVNLAVRATEQLYGDKLERLDELQTRTDSINAALDPTTRARATAVREFEKKGLTQDQAILLAKDEHPELFEGTPAQFNPAIHATTTPSGMSADREPPKPPTEEDEVARIAAMPRGHEKRAGFRGVLGKRINRLLP